MELTRKQIRSFQEMIFSWWKKNRRDLPWRRTHDPYKILVSEVMLQQTQVSRVLPIYQQFINEFPDVYSLANASAADVLRQWKGMGYNRRALYLQKAAATIVNEYNGVFPSDVTLLRKLPGIGEYTAGAVAVFAFKKQHAVIDTNIRQIITHFFFDDVEQKPSNITKAAEQLVPDGAAWEWHQALMDYGAIAMKLQRGKDRKTHRPVQPFRESKRFFRGRIIDRLRQSPVQKTDYLAELSQTYNKSTEFFLSLIAALINEGMVYEDSDGVLALPS